MNSPKVKAAIKELTERFKRMTPEDFKALDAQLPKGPFFNLLLNSGFVRANETPSNSGYFTKSVNVVFGLIDLSKIDPYHSMMIKTSHTPSIEITSEDPKNKIGVFDTWVA